MKENKIRHKKSKMKQIQTPKKKQRKNILESTENRRWFPFMKKEDK